MVFLGGFHKYLREVAMVLWIAIAIVIIITIIIIIIIHAQSMYSFMYLFALFVYNVMHLYVTTLYTEE